MVLHTREPRLGLGTRHRHDRDRAHEPAGLAPDRLSGAAQQGDRRAQRLSHGPGLPGRVLKERTTYEIMDATTVGLNSNSLVLGKHSGRHALSKALEEMGFEIDGQALNTAFKRFKEIADRKKQVTAMDLQALVTDELRSEDIGGFSPGWFEVEGLSPRPPQRVSVTLLEKLALGRLVHRRRTDRRRIRQGHQCRDRRRREAGSEFTDRRRDRGPRCAWRNGWSCLRSTVSLAPGREFRRTSSTPPRGPTCERCRSPSRARAPTRRSGCPDGRRH